MEFVSAFIGLIIVYYLQKFLYRIFWNVNLKADLKFSSEYATEGDTCVLEETIINRKVLPLPFVCLKFKVSKCLEFEDRDLREITDYYNRNELFSVLMFQKITRRLQFKCKKRGVYEIKTAGLLGSGVLMSEEYQQELELDTRLTVYPGCVNMELFQKRFEHLLGEIITTQYRNEDPFLFRGIRGYSAGDPMKKINWKASAKTSDLKVNVQEFTMEQNVELYLNLQWESLSSDSMVLEESIRLAKTFCVEFNKMGLDMALYTNGLHFETGEPVKVEFSGHRSFMERMNEGLAEIKIKEGGNAKLDDDFEAPAFTGLYEKHLIHYNTESYRVFISNYRHRDFQELLVKLIRSGQQICWIIPSENGEEPEFILPELEQKVLLWNMQWEEAKYL